MPGLRRLRSVSDAVGKKVSGALAGARDEVADATSEQAPEPAAEPSAPAPVEPGSGTPTTTDGAPVAAEQEEPVTVLEATTEPPAETTQPDAVCAAAVELARAVAVEVAGDAVGDHVGVEPEPSASGHAVTHSFATREVGYAGWRWAVTVARAEGTDVVTVDEVVLLPGSGALISPAWVPWDQRLQPGDLGPGDLLPPSEDDPRLVRSYEDADADELPFDLHRDLGLGRPRVLSAEGRFDAAERWHDGAAGPAAPIAKQAPGRCLDCGFLAPLAGSLGRGFGACANAMAPDDGRVVALLHGCGAHSEQPVPSNSQVSTGMAVEHEELELVDVASLPHAPAAGDDEDESD